MLTSIHPLGERARHNRWAVTATAFVIGAVGAGTSVAAVLGWLGGLLPAGEWRWPAAAALVVAAGVADLVRLQPPGPRRQVNEEWIGAFRGWVYGGAFGAQLGVGVSTFVVTWGVWATIVLALLSGDAGSGALIGTAFGLGRSVMPLAAGWIDRPSRLTSFSRAMARAARPAAIGAAIAFVAVPVVSLAWRLTA